MCLFSFSKVYCDLCLLFVVFFACLMQFEIAIPLFLDPEILLTVLDDVPAINYLQLPTDISRVCDKEHKRGISDASTQLYSESRISKSCTKLFV